MELYRKEYVKHVGFGEGDDGWNLINNESGEIIGQAHTETIADVALAGLNKAPIPPLRLSVITEAQFDTLRTAFNDYANVRLASSTLDLPKDKALKLLGQAGIAVQDDDVLYSTCYDPVKKDWMILEGDGNGPDNHVPLCRYRDEADANAVVKSLVEGTPLPYRLLKIIVVGDRYYGKGDTIEEARKNMNKEAGQALSKYIVYVVHPTARIDEMGSFCWHGGRSVYSPREIGRVGLPPRPQTQPKDGK